MTSPTTNTDQDQFPAFIPAPATGTQIDVPDVIKRLRLGSSAGLFLDLLKPVSWLGAQLVLVMQPALSILGAGREAGRLADYLAALDAPEAKLSEEAPCR